MLFNLFATIFGQRWSRRTQGQAQQLRGMSDLELRDLGMGRSEIPAMLSEHIRACEEKAWGNRL
ncbi:DUF1127 domain-containing protein [Undibacterium terreum]|uniref:YjiS-like domain-containing protein n=1 Tax=Undibacterium terreum TaxID=1224302 RepID=A0A916XG24_9BURK|nr:DUF1127 domain-containing protein [Undibacterium terreum]GGC67961.1 hypothetical protein GCM10011396_13770 [Undibacterium terreum]